MAGVSRSIQVNDAAVIAVLGGIAARAGDLYPAFDEIGGAMVTSTHFRFIRQAGPNGTPWRPSRRVVEEGGMTLTDTRYLDDSLTHVADRSGVEWGTNAPYAGIHQFGGVITRHAHSAPVYRDLDAVLADREAHKSGTSRFGAAPFVRRSKATLETWHEVSEYQIHMPARPYIGFNADDSKETTTILTKHVMPAPGDV